MKFKMEYKYTYTHPDCVRHVFNLAWMSKWGMTGGEYWLEEGIIGIKNEQPVMPWWRLW